MRKLHIDIETYSSVDLAKCGVYKYVESEDFEILLFAYALDDNPVICVDLTANPDRGLPCIIAQMIKEPEVLKIAHNTAFERVCLSKYLGVYLAPESWHCTMIHASILGLPASLQNVGIALCLAKDQQKDAEGKRLINYFCKPCKPTKINGGRTRNMPSGDPEKWDHFIAYNIQDVNTERIVYEKLMRVPITDYEYKVWYVDQRINDYGMLIDTDLMQRILDFADDYDERLKEECARITGGINVNAIQQLKDWMSEREGRVIKKLDKEAVSNLLMDKTISKETKRILEIRQETGKTSVTKYEAIKRALCKDNRLHGCLRFYGAERTGRWAGRILQPQNLPRNTFSDVDGARKMIKDGDIDIVDLFYDTYNNVFSTLIRTAVIPSQGHVFAVADYSAIEARVTAWFCDEKWRQDVFAGDGKIYEASASQMFHVPIEEVTKGSDLRKKGKVAELALGYGGGVSAMERMGGAAMGLSEDEMQAIVQKWRAASPHIKNMWYTIQRAAETAINEKRQVSVAHGVSYYYQAGFLFAKLPSGRSLAYAHPCVQQGQYGNEIYYDSATYANGKPVRVSAWGGKLFENLIQAIARDCLAITLVKLHDRGYKTVMHVHDEVIVEVSDSIAMSALDRIEAIMAEPIDWAPGLLLTADGFISKYYKKD